MRPGNSSFLFLSMTVIALLGSSSSWAGNSATATFNAHLVQGECTATLDSGSHYTLGTFLQSEISEGMEGQVIVQSPPLEVHLNCTGETQGIPRFTMTASPGTTYVAGAGAKDTTFFRNNNASAPDTALAFRMQYLAGNQVTLPGGVKEWSNFLEAGTYDIGNLPLQDFDEEVSFFVKFSMWCVPVSPQTISNCRIPGKTTAGFDFLVYMP